MEKQQENVFAMRRRTGYERKAPRGEMHVSSILLYAPRALQWVARKLDDVCTFAAAALNMRLKGRKMSTFLAVCAFLLPLPPKLKDSLVYNSEKFL